MQIDALIDEIKALKDSPIRKSAADIHRLLDNHKAQFVKKLDPNDYRHLLDTFETLADGMSGNEAYKRDYDTAYNLLVFYLNRII